MSCIAVEQTRSLPIVLQNIFVQHSKMAGTAHPQTKICVPLSGSGLTYWESIAITLCKNPSMPEKPTVVVLGSHIKSNGFILTHYKNSIPHYNEDSVNNTIRWRLEVMDVFTIGNEKRNKCVFRGVPVEGLDDPTLVIDIHLHVYIESINVLIKGWKKRNEDYDARIHSFKFYPNRVYSLRQVLNGCDALLSLRLSSCILSPKEHKAHIIANGRPTGIMVTSSQLDDAIPSWILKKTVESKVGQNLSKTERAKVLLVSAQYDDLWLEFDEDISKLTEVPLLEVKELKMFSTNGRPYFANQ